MFLYQDIGYERLNNQLGFPGLPITSLEKYQI